VRVVAGFASGGGAGFAEPEERQAFRAGGAVYNASLIVSTDMLGCFVAPFCTRLPGKCTVVAARDRRSCVAAMATS
jgi:hypothetical protein